MTKNIETQRNQRCKLLITEKEGYSSALNQTTSLGYNPIYGGTSGKIHEQSVSNIDYVDDTDPLILDDNEKDLFQRENQLLAMQLQNEVEDVR